MPLLSIPANDIDTSGVRIDAALPASWLDQQLAQAQARGAAPGHVTARLSRSGKDIVVRGRVRAPLTVPCARCLDPAPVDVDTELSLLLRSRPGARVEDGSGARARSRGPKAPAKAKGGHPPDAEYEFSSDEAEQDSYDGETVVLDDFVREAVLLELPNFPLCSEACPGIRPPGSAEPGPALVTEIDPRLAPLGALRAKLVGGTNGSAEPAPAGAARGASGPTRTRRSPIRANQTKTKRKRSR